MYNLQRCDKLSSNIANSMYMYRPQKTVLQKIPEFYAIVFCRTGEFYATCLKY